MESENGENIIIFIILKWLWVKSHDNASLNIISFYYNFLRNITISLSQKAVSRFSILLVVLFCQAEFPLVFERCLGVLEVVLGGDYIMINSEVWDKIILIVLIHVCLEFLRSSCLGFSNAFWECVRIASWDRLLLLLCKFPGVTQWLFSILKVTLSCDDIMVNSEVWYKIVFVMFVHISLKLFWCCCLSFCDTFWECIWVACWNGLLFLLG